MQSYDIAVVGPAGVGKTVWLRRIIVGDFVTEHRPTSTEEIRAHSIATNRGTIAIRFHDCPVGQLCSALPDAWILVVTKETLSDLASLRGAIPTNAPVVVAVNKCDRCDANLSPAECAELRAVMREGDLAYPISARSNYHFEKPVLAVLRIIKHDPGLFFVEEAPITPTEVHLM